MNQRYIIRTILLFFLLLVLATLLYLGLVPSGSISYSYDFIKESAFLSKLEPNTRLESIKDDQQKIIADPVYFSARTPRSFDKVKLSFEYNSDNLHAPLLEAGILVDNTLWRYDTKPLENKIIDATCASWYKIEADGLVFCQKNAKFSSIDEFLSSSTSPESIALYNYKIDKEYLLPEYSATEDMRTISLGLRGAFEFYTYIKDEVLQFELELLDLNENRDPDRIDMNLYYNDKLIDVRGLEDDGSTKDDGVRSDLRNLSFRLPDLPEGIYKLELRVNDDIVTKSIKTSQSKLSFKNKLRFYKQDRKDLLLYSDANKYEATTIYPDSLQTIKVGDASLDLTETYQQASLKVEGGDSFQEILIPSDGLVLSGNGVFAFDKDALLNPNYKKIDTSLNLASGKIEYLLARYKSPEEEGGWKKASVEFDLDRAYRENRTYSFIISIPGLKSSSHFDQYVLVNNIEAEFSGETLLELVSKRFFDK